MQKEPIGYKPIEVTSENYKEKFEEKWWPFIEKELLRFKEPLDKKEGVLYFILDPEDDKVIYRGFKAIREFEDPVIYCPYIPKVVYEKPFSDYCKKLITTNTF